MLILKYHHLGDDSNLIDFNICRFFKNANFIGAHFSSNRLQLHGIKLHFISVITIKKFDISPGRGNAIGITLESRVQSH